MQGANINSEDSSLYGDGTGTASGYLHDSVIAGNYELNVVSAFGAGTITLASPTINAYRSDTAAFPIYRYQVVTMQRWNPANAISFTGAITCPQWVMR